MKMLIMFIPSILIEQNDPRIINIKWDARRKLSRLNEENYQDSIKIELTCHRQEIISLAS